MKWKPWESSTGPVTEEGKAIASKNSFQHGAYSAEVVEGRRYVASLGRQLKELRNFSKFFSL
jgi:hypothetical protein